MNQFAEFAIREADEVTKYHNLPTYSELLQALRRAQTVMAGVATGDLQTIRPDSPALQANRAILARIPEGR